MNALCHCRVGVMKGYRPVRNPRPHAEDTLPRAPRCPRWIYWVALLEFIVILIFVVSSQEVKRTEYVAFNVPHGEPELPIRVIRNTSTSNVYKYDLSYPDDSFIIAGKVMRFLEDDGRDRFDIFTEITSETAFGEYAEQTGKVSDKAIQFRIVNLETDEEAVLLPIGLSYSIFKEGVGSLFPTFYFFSYRKHPTAKPKTTFVSLFAGVTSFYGDAEKEYYEFHAVLNEYMSRMFRDNRRRLQTSIIKEARLGATTAAVGKLMSKISKTQGGNIGYMAMQCKLQSTKTCIEDAAYVGSSIIGTMAFGQLGGMVVKSVAETAVNHKSFLTNLAGAAGYTAGAAGGQVVAKIAVNTAEHVAMDAMGGELAPVVKAGLNMAISGAATYIAGNLGSKETQKAAGYLEQKSKFLNDADTKVTNAIVDSKISKKANVLINGANTEIQKVAKATKTKFHELFSDF